jgi:hypothetical protein
MIPKVNAHLSCGSHHHCQELQVPASAFEREGDVGSIFTGKTLFTMSQQGNACSST